MVEQTPPKEFARLRRSGRHPGAGLMLGGAALWARDAVVLRLAAAGVSPDLLSWLSLGLAVAAGACLGLGAGHLAPWAGATPSSWWPLVGSLCLLASAVVDALDGALARAGGQQAASGALLDSVLDRFGELAIYLGCAVYFVLAGNVTYVVLSILAFGSGFQVSYIKARTEGLGGRCAVGYWQRGERFVFFTVAAFIGHVPAGLWLGGIGPLLTAARRLRYGRDILSGRERALPQWAHHAAIWRHPRGSVGYDAFSLVLLVFLFVAPRIHPIFTAGADPLRGVLSLGS